MADTSTSNRRDLLVARSQVETDRHRRHLCTPKKWRNVGGVASTSERHPGIPASPFWINIRIIVVYK